MYKWYRENKGRENRKQAIAGGTQGVKREDRGSIRILFSEPVVETRSGSKSFIISLDL